MGLSPTEKRIRENLKENLSKLVNEVDLVAEIDDLLETFIGDKKWDEHVVELMEKVVLKPFKNLRIALLVVDFQNDFVSGSLSIKEGDAEEDPIEALPHVNNLLQNMTWNMIVYTQDWHPSNHISFFEHSRNPDRELAPEDKSRKLRPFDIVRFIKPVSTVQVLYPSHCIQGGWGSQLHSELHRIESAQYIKKGNDVYVDAYSAFSDNCGIKQSELEILLRKNDINAVIGCGLAYDICVMHTLKDASKRGFLTSIVRTGSKGLSSLKMDEANEMFQKRGVAIIDDEMARNISTRQAYPIEWIRLLIHQAQIELHGKK
ncbi:unnamed protein product [Caenorhabditis angaria]|uniref:nicotinamidase n=1 Tax=Caenorhabditis angaria TaxID=860376 RepID=A0A9P1IMY7_9PELO|nr:unnamed protein product [Caenorhabditis angaria]